MKNFQGTEIANMIRGILSWCDKKKEQRKKKERKIDRIIAYKSSSHIIASLNTTDVKFPAIFHNKTSDE